ncbi:MAG: hypothetical protein ABIN36_03070 [Ferruginibacter sp.]
MLISAKEKAQLSVEVLEKFAPYMDSSTDLFQKMGVMISNFGVLVESFSELPDEQKKEFMQFIGLFQNYIETATSNYNDLRGFYSYMTQTTNSLITEFKQAIGVE